MPVHNAEPYLDEAVSSILAQTLQDLELIMVDDGSTDGSYAMAEEYAGHDPRIKLYRNPSNLGVARTRNIAMGQASGTYVASLDNDDWAHPRRLELQVAFLEANRDHGLVGSDIDIMDEGSKVTGCRIYPHDDRDIRRALLRFNPIANPAAMFPMEVFRELGGAYAEEHCPVEDYEFVLRVARRYRLANLPQRLTRYRVRRGQAKSLYLKKTIRETILLQHQARQAGLPDPAMNRLHRLGLGMLLLLPSPLVLELFKKISYRQSA
jgi:glycosyltransferase involved in cell wall biosynthesis